MAIPTQARAAQYFNYIPETGDLLVVERPRDEFDAPAYARHIKRIGMLAGGVHAASGYRKVLIDGRYYPAHKIIWLIVTGNWVSYPEFEIDHINGKCDDNRWENLRVVTKSENQRNSSQRVNNTSGVHGVNWKPRKNGGGYWVARIWNGPKHVYLGQFKDIKHAEIARKAGERALGYTGTDRPSSKLAK